MNMEGKVQSIDYVCQVGLCEKKFSNAKELRQHLHSHPDKLLECEECDKKFTRKCDLTRHCRTSHPEVGEVECDECGKKFFNKVMLNRHSLVHARQKNNNSSEYSKNFSEIGKASLQLMNDSGGIFECGECGKTFTDRAPLNLHMKVHRGEKVFECNTCGRQFGASSHLTRHELIHTGVKNFKCIACGKRFARKDKLNKHMDTHPGVKMFVCSVGTCGWKFTHRAQLDEHEIMHDKTCFVCGKTFKRKDKLNRHMVVHTGAKDYRCDRCGKKFSRKDSLNAHLMTHTEMNEVSHEECSKIIRNHRPGVCAGINHVDMETFECGECGDNFFKKAQLLKHMAKHE